MLNIEYYWEQIKELDYHFAKRDGELWYCRDCSCNKCDFFQASECDLEKIKWLGTEHAEFTEEEIHLLKCMNPDAYLARDASGDLYYYSNKPYVNNSDNVWVNDEDSKIVNNNLFKNVHFNFIKWEDEEPYLVSELLKIASVTNDKA